MQAQKEIESLLANLNQDVLYDSLTQAYSKDTFFVLANYFVEKKYPFTLCLIDFDNFKKVNDNLGHQIGDNSLKECLTYLKESSKDKAYWFRFGGDEFLAFYPFVENREEVWNNARDYTEGLRSHLFSYLCPIFQDGKISITSGIASYPKNGDTISQILSLCDKCLYIGKMRGKNCYIIYDKNLHEKIDIEAHKKQIDKEKIISFIFKNFEINKDPIHALKNIFELLGEHFEDNIVVYHSHKDDIILYDWFERKDIVYHRISKKHITLDENGKKLFYLSNIINKEEYAELSKILVKSNLCGLYVIQVVGLDKKKGYLYILTKREKIYSDFEKYLYDVVANLFSFVNKNNN